MLCVADVRLTKILRLSCLTNTEKMCFLRNDLAMCSGYRKIFLEVVNIVLEIIITDVATK